MRDYNGYISLNFLKKAMWGLVWKEEVGESFPGRRVMCKGPEMGNTLKIQKIKASQCSLEQ